MTRPGHRVDSLWSWFTTVCASLSIALSFGLCFSFGVLLADLMTEFKQGRQKTVWVGSLTIALLYFLSPLGSVLCQTIGCRFTAIIGGLTCAVSLLVSSFSRSLELMFFIFSFLYALGGTLIYMASILITAKNFLKWRTLAVGIAGVGESFGGILFGPFTQFLLDVVSWRGAYRITSALLCLVCVLGVSFSEPTAGENEESSQKVALKSSSAEEDLSTKNVEKSEESVLDFNSDETLNSSPMANGMRRGNKSCGDCEYGDSIVMNWEKSLSSVLFTKGASHKDVKEAGPKSVKDAASPRGVKEASPRDVKEASPRGVKEASPRDAKEKTEGKTSKLLDFSVLKHPRFAIILMSLSFTCFGHFTPSLHLVRHCLELGISADSASKLFIFIGLASSVARVVSGRLCDLPCIKTIYVYQFGVLLVGFMTVALPFMKSYAGILVFSVFYGVGDGVFVTTMNSLLMFTLDEKDRAAAVGLGSSLLSIGIAGGPPLAGLLADRFDGYMWSFTFAGILLLCAGIVPVFLLCLKNDRKGRQINELQQV